ncbi:hypothetical protein FB451DRAFT_1261788 [Mycena latifolia]|nr:hypothetical protein FB451DRAFT_1261788 [Mycena latifolia]
MGTSATPYQHIVPPEIWLACWTLCSTRQLRRLSLVCQLFRSLCLPLLFQCLQVNAVPLGRKVNQDNWIARVRHLHRTAVRLDRLAQGRHALLVRSWKFVAREILNLSLFDTISERVIKTFSSTFGVYRSLRTLYIQGFVIDTSLQETLCSLPRLDELTLCNCDIIAQDDPGRLRSLHLDTPYTWRLLASFGTEKFPHLIEVSLGVLSDVTLFFSFLKQCPRLERLTISHLHRDMTPHLPTSLHPTIVPLLRHLTVPRELIPLFTPNRPVNEVTVGSEVPPLLMEISHTSAPLLFLEISCASPSDESMATIASMFPFLRLSIEVPETPWVARRSPMTRPQSVDSRCPSLCDDDAFNDLPSEEISDAEEDEPSTVGIFHRICTDSLPLPLTTDIFRLKTPPGLRERGPMPLERRHQTLAVLSQQCPLLREVQLGLPCYNWTRIGSSWKQKGVNSHVHVDLRGAP